MQENEYKFMTDKLGFVRLKNILRTRFPLAAISERVQINYYYDTETFDLHKNHATLRARQSENGIKLQLKHRVGDKDGCRISTEMYWKIEQIAEMICLPNTVFPQGNLAGGNIYTLLGSLVTQRESVHISDNLTVEFDKNFYLGFCDYEIEIETDKENISAAQRLISELSLLPSEPKSKFARFIKAREGMSREICL